MDLNIITISLTKKEMYKVRQSNFRRDCLMAGLIRMDDAERTKLFVGKYVRIDMIDTGLLIDNIMYSWKLTGQGAAELYFSHLKAYTEEGIRVRRKGRWVSQTFDTDTASWIDLPNK